MMKPTQSQYRIALIGTAHQLEQAIVRHAHDRQDHVFVGHNVRLSRNYLFKCLIERDWDAIVVFSSAFSNFAMEFLRELKRYANASSPRGLCGKIFLIYPASVALSVPRPKKFEEVGVAHAFPMSGKPEDHIELTKIMKQVVSKLASADPI